jgi:hypothetical protein
MRRSGVLRSRKAKFVNMGRVPSTVITVTVHSILP